MPAELPRKPLLSPELQAKIPRWGPRTADDDDPVALVKFVLSCDLGDLWTWYLVDYDGKDRCYGLVACWEVGMAGFAISELESLYDEIQASRKLAAFFRGGNTVTLKPVERDERFQPTRVSVLSRQHKARLRLLPRALRYEADL